jgi:broad specificity phosphatase PhoE
MISSRYTPALQAERNPIVTRLLLARHGETDWNRRGRWHGQANIPLNSVGRQQAMALSASLKDEPLAAVYCSTLQRAVETAQAVAAVHRLNVCRDARLNELDLGQWEGMTRKDIAARYPDLLQEWDADPASMRLPEGESIADLEERVMAVIHEIALAYPGETVCLVGHKMTNGIIRSRYMGLPLADALGSVPEHAIWEEAELPYPFL